MEPREKVYLVTFGAGNTYRLDANISRTELEESPKSPLRLLIERAKEYLHKQFPAFEIPETLVTPAVEEVLDAKKASGIHPLDHQAENEILASLALQAKNMQFQQELSDDAPFNDVGPNTQVG